MLKGKTIFRVTRRGYEPADEEGRAQHAKFQEGDLIAAGVSRPRSLPQAHLYWAIIEHVAQATHWQHKRKLHNALRIKLGRYDLETFPNGKKAVVLDSTAFEEMNADEFTEYFNEAIALICEEVLGGMSSDDLIREVQAMLGGKPTERAA